MKSISKKQCIIRVSIFIILMFMIIPAVKVHADEYPYKNGDWHKVDPWKYFQRECTSYCAWRINTQLNIKFHNYYKGYNWGDAGTWDDAARKTGVTVNQTPAKWSIAYCDPYTHDSGSAGHVAWVYRVSGNKVYVMDYNWGNTHKYKDRMLDKSAFSGYIHIEKLAKTFTVKYNANGGKGSMANTTIVYGVGANIRKNAFTRANCTFVGWNLYKHSEKKWYYTNGSKKGWYTLGKQPSGYYLEVYRDQALMKWTTEVNKDTIELYAVWKSTLPKYPVYLCGDGSTLQGALAETRTYTQPSGEDPDRNPADSATVTVSGVRYKITGTTATCTGLVKARKAVTIPATIKYNNKTYKVTAIAANAFRNNKKLKKVVIGKYVKKIGKRAFAGCKRLKKIIIKTKKLTGKSVGAYAFKGIYKKAVVKCPKGKVKAYKKILLKKGMKKTMKFK